MSPKKRSFGALDPFTTTAKEKERKRLAEKKRQEDELKQQQSGGSLGPKTMDHGRVMPGKRKIDGGGNDDDDDGGAQASKRFKAHKTTSNATVDRANKMTAIHPKLPRFYEVESSTAAYLSFDNIRDIRLFTISHLFLPWYRLYRDSGQETTVPKLLEAYKKIKSASSTEESLRAEIESLSSSQANPETLATERARLQVSILLSYVSWLELQEIPDKESTLGLMQKSVNDHWIAISKLNSGDAPKTPDLSGLGTVSLVKPQFGPHQCFAEHPNERFGRVYTLFRRMTHSVSPSRVIPAYLGQRSFKNSPVPASAIPKWMRSEAPVDGDANSSASGSHTEDAILSDNPATAIAFTPKQWTLLYADNDPVQSEIMTAIKQTALVKKVSPIRDPQAFKTDPRKYATEFSWRDAMRAELNFKTLDVDFKTLYWESKDDVINLLQTDDTDTWSSIQDRLSVAIDSHISFKFSLNILNLQDDESYPFEFDGDVESELLTVDKAIALIAKDSSSATGTSSDSGSLIQPSVFPAISGKADDKWQARCRKIQRQKYLEPVPLLFLSPADLFPKKDDTADMLIHYSGINPLDPNGLRRWQRDAIEHATRGSIQEDPSRNTFTEEKDGDPESVKAFKDAMWNQDQEEKPANELDVRDSERRAVFGGSESIVGPPVIPSRKLLSMSPAGTIRSDCKLPIFSTDVVNTKATFLDTQITGACFMLSRSCGKVPVSPERAEDPELQLLIKKSLSPETRGGLLVDATGLGKTLTSLLFLTVYNKFASPRVDGDQVLQNKPSLILLPSYIVLKQWVEVIESLFPDLQILILYSPKGDSELEEDNQMADSASPSNDDFEEKRQEIFVSPKLIERGIEGIQEYILSAEQRLNPLDRSTRNVVFLSTYNTFCGKSVAERKLSNIDDGKAGEKGKKGRKPKSENKPQKGYLKWQSKWEGYFEVLLCDEAHKMRHCSTKTFAAIFHLRSSITWMLTATPIVNSSSDLTSYVRVLWSRIATRLDERMKQERIDMHALKHPFKRYEELALLPYNDTRKLLILFPRALVPLQSLSDVASIAEYFCHVEEILMIRRTAHSKLPMDYDSSDTLDLRSIMPPYTIITRDAKYTASEARSMEDKYADYLTQALSELKKAGSHMNIVDGKKRRPEGPSQKALVLYSPVHLIYRKMALLSSSTLLSRFDRDANFKVEWINNLRAGCLTVEQLVKATIRLDTNPLQTRRDVVRALCEGSPKLRAALRIIQNKILPLDHNTKTTKLLIATEYPAVAWFYELALSYLHIKTAVLHAQLSDYQRDNLVRTFKRKTSDLQVMITTYAVSSQGVNLDTACNLAIIETAAVNGPTEFQTWGRLVRVSQTSKVEIYRLRAQNSNDMYRDSRQAEKSLADLAARSSGQSARKTLVNLLNENRNEIHLAKSSKVGRKVLSRQADAGSFFAHFRSKLQRPSNEDVKLKHLKKSKGSSQVESDDSSVPGRQLREKGVHSSFKSQLPTDDDISDTDPTSDPEDSDFNLSSDSDDSESEEDIDNTETRGANLLTDSMTIQAVKTWFSKLPIEMQLKVNWREVNTAMLCCFDEDREYTEDDLSNPLILERAIRLLNKFAFGQQNALFLPVPAITFEHLAKEALEAKLDAYQVANRKVQPVTSPEPDPESPKSDPPGVGIYDGANDARFSEMVSKSLSGWKAVGGCVDKVNNWFTLADLSRKRKLEL